MASVVPVSSTSLASGTATSPDIIGSPGSTFTVQRKVTCTGTIPPVVKLPLATEDETPVTHPPVC